MLVKLRISKLVSYTLPRRIGDRHFPVHTNALSTTAESPAATADSSDSVESPELPSWVKDFIANRPSSTTAVPDEDDFVIPSLASWVEHQKLGGGEEIAAKILAKKPTVDIDKVSDILRRRATSWDGLAEELSGCGVVVSDGLVLQVLRRFRNEWDQAYGFFTWAKSQTGYRHTSETYDEMVDVLGKCRKFDLMWEVVEEMNREPGCVTINTMTKVMRRLAKAGIYTEAVEAFQEMENYGVVRDTNSMNILMDALVKEDSVEHASDVFLNLQDSIQCNAHTFNILIHGYCKARKFKKAWRTIDEMRSHGFIPDVVSYTNFIEAYCREKDFRRVYSLLEEMQEKGCKPSSVTYTIVMHALGKANQVAEALDVYMKMRQNWCVPDTKLYSSLIFILSKSGRFKDATEIFEDMPNQGALRDVLTYNTMISSACARSQEEMAFGLLKRMEEDSCRPNIETYAPLLKMCCRKKRMKLMWVVLHHMVKNDVSIDIMTYILLIRGLCKSGKLRESCLFFEEAVSKGMVPRESTCRMLVEALDRKRMADAKGKIETLISQLEKVKDSNSPSISSVGQ